YRRNRQASLQERSLQMDRELASLRDRRARMVELYERTGQADLTGDNLSPEEKRLQQLRDQLASALVLYSEQNPNVRTLRAQVEALEAQVLARRNAGTAGGENLSAFELQLTDIDGQVDFLVEQKQIVEDELTDLAKSIEETPKNAVTLGSLQRDYDNLRTQYNRATSDLAAARTGDQIEAQ
ncbi:lipopolysaccharide biosynthesis protein, partial [Escherichia coli]|nr:lipopolysaccharide biosynthesis protein [Escherichia coli]